MLEPEGVPIVIVSVQPAGSPVELIVTEAIATDPVLVTVIGRVFSPISSWPQLIVSPLVQDAPFTVNVALAPIGAVAVCGIEYCVERTPIAAPIRDARQTIAKMIMVFFCLCFSYIHQLQLITIIPQFTYKVCGNSVMW